MNPASRLVRSHLSAHGRLSSFWMTTFGRQGNLCPRPSQTEQCCRCQQAANGSISVRRSTTSFERSSCLAGPQTRLRDQDEMVAFRLHLTHELIDVTLTRTDGAEVACLPIRAVG